MNITTADGKPDKRQGTGVYRPVLALAAAALAVLALIMAVMVNQFDTVSGQLQFQFAQQGYINRVAEFGALVQARVDTDAAVEHLALRFDPDWAEHELAHSLYDRHGVSDMAVLDAGDRAVFVAHGGKRASLQTYRGPVADSVADLVPRLRRAEAARPRLFSSRAHPRRLPKVDQFSTITFDRGTLYIVTATLVQPDFGRVAQTAARAPVVVIAVPFDQRLLGRFAARYLVTNLRVDRDFSETGDHTFMPLFDINGRRVAALSWISRRPGSELFARLEWPLGLMVVILLLLGWSLARQTARYAKGLILSEARARHLAYHDTLTQLPNRALMFERLNQLRALAHRAPLDIAVHCIDLDRFKEVNDTLGHPAGDALIRAAARRLAGLLRETDTVARLGGDEFVILQPHTVAPGAAHLAERIINAFARPFEIEGHVVEIGCSIGITLIGDPETPASELLRQADLALYSSKEKGRNCATFFEPEMDAALRMRCKLESDLREALADEALHMVYQPQVDADGTIVGVEALVRWDHPEKGLIPPFTFVVLAEESGLIAQLGDFIVRRVFAETCDLRDLPVAINVSALQLRTPAFMAAVTRYAAEYAIDTTNYEFEITETVLLGDDAATRDTIAALKQEGFAIALDDFGTGYSSLSSLQRFAVDRIKIDRAFVRNLDSDDSEAVPLIDAIIRLAHALDLEVIAEGVETVAQRDRLIACGCNRFQGFLFARPMAAADLRALLASGRRAGPADLPPYGAQALPPPRISPRRRRKAQSILLRSEGESLGLTVGNAAETSR